MDNRRTLQLDWQFQESDRDPDDASNRGVDRGFRRDGDLVALVSDPFL